MICIKKLNIELKGYKHGAALFFRVTGMHHIVHEWTGAYRYTFNHTKHHSVEQQFGVERKHGDCSSPKILEQECEASGKISQVLSHEKRSTRRKAALAANMNMPEVKARGKGSETQYSMKVSGHSHLPVD